MAEQYAVHFLGTARLEQGGRPLRGMQSRKAVALLGYLAARDEPVSRMTVASMLWPELSEARALANLAWILSHLAQHLPGALATDRHNLRWQHSAEISLDLAQLRALRRRGDVTALEQAAALCHGAFMEGFYLNGCPDFELWLVREREHWHQVMVQLFDELIRIKQEYGALREALALARRLLELDPNSEESHRMLMLLLALDGQKSAALAQFESCRRMLDDEFGIEPGEQTLQLLQQIRTEGGDLRRQLREGPAAPAKLAEQLPSQLTPFFGREAELEQLAEALRSPNQRLVTIVGPGGIGKTRLALQLVRQTQRMFQHGAAIVPLAAAGTLDAAAFAIARTLQLALSSAEDPVRELIAQLEGRQLLLVLDNLEQLSEAGALALQLLSGCPRLKLVVTSRERLRLQIETLLPLSGLDLPQGGQQAERSGAVQLFSERARRVRPDFQLDAESSRQVAGICRMVQGSPLAIELAAVWLDTMSCAALEQAIQQSLDILSSQMVDLPARQRSLRAVFNHSWALLSERERQAFRSLAVFRGLFDQQAALAVCQVDLRLLATLRDKSLLHARGDGRFELHELLAQYALEQLAAMPQEQGQLRRRHAEHYAELAEAALRSFNGALPGAWLDELEQQYANLQAALEWSVAQREAALALRISGALWRFWEFAIYWQEGARWLEQALRLADEQGLPSQSPLVARCQRSLGALRLEMAQFTQAWQVIEQSHATFQALDDRAELVVLCGLMGRIRVAQGRTEEAQRWLTRQLELAGEVGDTYEQSAALNSLGRCFGDHGHYHKALELWQRGLEIAGGTGNYRMVTRLTANLGLAYEGLGDYVRAFEIYRRTLELASQHGCRRELQIAIGNMGEIYQRHGRADEARCCFQRCLDMAVAAANRSMAAWALCWLAHLLGQDQPGQAAEELYRRAIGLQRLISFPSYLAHALLEYAEYALGQRQLVEAERALCEALEVCAQYGYHTTEREFRAHLLMLRLDLLRGRCDAAQAAARLDALRRDWREEDQLAEIDYLLWELDPTRAKQCDAAARRFAALYQLDPRPSYLQRHLALTGQPLPTLSALPDLSPIILQDLKPLDALLAACDRLSTP